MIIVSSGLALRLDLEADSWDKENMAALPMQACPRCGELLADIKGSRLAVCRRCGYKDDCC